MKFKKSFIIAFILMSAHGLTLAQKAVRGICDGHPGCPKSGAVNQQNATNNKSSAEKAQQVLKAIGAIGAATGRPTEAAAENKNNTSRQPLTNNYSQSNTCPSSIMAGGSQYDLAGAIAIAGSPSALLGVAEQGLREMSADCSTFANAGECSFTKALWQDIRSALKKCIAAGAVSVAGGDEMQSPKTDEDCRKLFPIDEQYKERYACLSRVAKQNLSSAGAAFNAIQSQSAPVIADSNPWTPAPFKPLDPTRDYSGQSCSYFTKPAREGDYRLNYYANDSFACYGTKMYKCAAGRWESKGPCAAYQDSDRLRAEKLESSTLNTKVHEE